MYINDQLKGKTPYQGLSHMIGDQLNIKLKEPSHYPYEFNVSLDQAITQLDPVVLEAGQAKLMVLIEPATANAVVYVDGQAKGIAPFQMDLTTRPHEIYANANGKKTQVAQVHLKEGEYETLTLSFNQELNSKDSQLLTQMGIELVDIPAGTFQIGLDSKWESDDETHRVTLPAFKIMKYEVTQALWQYVMGYNPSQFSSCGSNCPVENVSWNDVQFFIQTLNKQTGMNFRLPSEAEWEYAARAGTTSKYSWGSSIDCSKARYGYYADGCGKKKSTDPVGSFQPNQWGLYDMHGNVWEWTQDCWNDSHNGALLNGAARDTGDCNHRVLRGGSWYSMPYKVSVAYRFEHASTDGDNDYGFRLVLDD